MPQTQGLIFWNSCKAPTKLVLVWATGIARSWKSPQPDAGIHLWQREIKLFLRVLNVKRAYQPRDNYLLENEGVRPDLDLPSQVAA